MNPLACGDGTVWAESFGALGSTFLSSQPCCFFFPVLGGTQIDRSDLCTSQVTYPISSDIHCWFQLYKWLGNYWGSLRCSLPASLTWSAATMPQVTSPARSSATSQMIVARLKNSFAAVFLSSLLRFVCCKVMFPWVGWYWYSGCWPLPKWCLAYGGWPLAVEGVHEAISLETLSWMILRCLRCPLRPWDLQLTTLAWDDMWLKTDEDALLLLVKTLACNNSGW